LNKKNAARQYNGMLDNELCRTARINIECLIFAIAPFIASY